MARTRVTCYFPVPNVPAVTLGAFSVWYVDVEVDERDGKAEVLKAIALATGAKFSSLKIRLGGFNEILAFDVDASGLRVGACGYTEAVYDKRLLRAHELNDVGCGSAFDLPDFDPSKYDGRYDWKQKDPDERR